mmetsp:Transcript_82534/g.114625  ORF Transcript_82534/g.114625 Transcript_82534/m.114625 type:complete len:230 (-) Transcript_82534:2681-3370(-)
MYSRNLSKPISYDSPSSVPSSFMRPSRLPSAGSSPSDWRQLLNSSLLRVLVLCLSKWRNTSLNSSICSGEAVLCCLARRSFSSTEILAVSEFLSSSTRDLISGTENSVWGFFCTPAAVICWPMLSRSARRALPSSVLMPLRLASCSSMLPWSEARMAALLLTHWSAVPAFSAKLRQRPSFSFWRASSASRAALRAAAFSWASFHLAVVSSREAGMPISVSSACLATSWS